MFNLEHMTAHSAPAGGTGKRRLGCIRVRVQTLPPVLRIRQEMVWVFMEQYMGFKCLLINPLPV